MDGQKCFFCIPILMRCTLATQPQQSNYHTLNWDVFRQETRILWKLVSHLLGKGRQSHQTFINGTLNIGYGVKVLTY